MVRENCFELYPMARPLPPLSTVPTAAPIPGRLLFVLFVFSVAVQLAWMDSTVGVYDEGLALLGADRVLGGDVPYRDFFTLYAPGGFYAMAGLFHVFGEFAIVERLYDAVVKALAVGASFLLLLNFGRVAVAWLGSLLVLALLIHLRNYGVVLFPAVAFALLGVLALHRATTRQSGACALAAGLAVAVSTTFRHDVGAYTLFACAVFLIDPHGGRRMPAADGQWSAGRLFFAAYACAVLPLLCWLVAVVPWRELQRNLIDIPLFVYPRVRELPFPDAAEALRKAFSMRSPAPLAPLSVFLPLAVALWCLVREARAGRLRLRRVEVSPAESLFRFLAVLNIVYFAKGLVRVSGVQMGASLLVSILLVTAGVAMASHRRWDKGFAVVGTGGACAALLLALLFGQWAGNAAALCRDRSVPRLTCLRLDKDQTAVARYLLDHGGAGQRVFFGLGRHDKIFISDQALAFAVSARPVTYWHDLHPGVQTTAEVQSEMIAEFVARAPDRVVLNRRWDSRAEPNDSARSEGVTLLDDYLRANFRPVYSSGRLTVLVPAGPTPESR